MKQRPRSAFSLLELLMVLGVLGALMGMLMPSVGLIREKAQRMVSANKLRQVGLAVASYTQLTGESLKAASLQEWMAELASETQLVEQEVYFFTEDPLVRALADPIPLVVAERAGPGDWRPVPGLEALPVGLAVASGLDPFAPPSTTPVAWTRGLTVHGSWRDHGSARSGVYGAEGGFIVFLDGHVRFYRDLTRDGGQLVSADGKQTADIRAALGPGVKAFDYLGEVF
jgi:type II secretory pathway pseudopilin PulG